METLGFWMLTSDLCEVKRAARHLNNLDLAPVQITRLTKSIVLCLFLQRDARPGFFHFAQVIYTSALSLT